MLSIDFYRPNYDMDVKELVDRLIDLSFAEDIGDGDHTTLCCIPEDARESRICSSRRTVFWLAWKWPRKFSTASTLKCRWKCSCRTVHV